MIYSSVVVSDDRRRHEHALASTWREGLHTINSRETSAWPLTDASLCICIFCQKLRAISFTSGVDMDGEMPLM